jgi:hypothetical protein
MARALNLAADSQVLRSHPRLIFTIGPYVYNIIRDGERSVYSVSDGIHTFSEPISWAFGFGIGAVGQTYVFRHDGSYYESHVTFYSEIRNLDITVGHPQAAPTSLEDAAGRALPLEEVRRCFGCHSTAAVSGPHLQLDQLIPGITCEGCHGAGGEHVAAMKAGRLENLHIFNPGKLKAGDLVSFCGACHRTQMHVESIRAHGVNTVRFQPYRLVKSRCYNADDRRISCLACHDPHREVERDPAFYDSRCLACHLSRPSKNRIGKPSAPACPVARHRCVTCHMPKYRLAGSHFRFADHRIRVVRVGEDFDG